MNYYSSILTLICSKKIRWKLFNSCFSAVCRLWKCKKRYIIYINLWRREPLLLNVKHLIPTNFIPKSLCGGVKLEISVSVVATDVFDNVMQTAKIENIIRLFNKDEFVAFDAFEWLCTYPLMLCSRPFLSNDLCWDPGFSWMLEEFKLFLELRWFLLLQLNGKIFVKLIVASKDYFFAVIWQLFL